MGQGVNGGRVGAQAGLGLCLRLDRDKGEGMNRGQVTAAIAAIMLTGQAMAQISPSTSARLRLFDKAQRFCIAKHLFDADLTASVIRSGNWSIAHICECASALTVSKMTDEEVSQDGSRENMDKFNMTLSTNISTCVHIQP